MTTQSSTLLGILVVAALLAGTAGTSSVARAATPPFDPSVAVSKPANLPMRLPWKAGDQHVLGAWRYNGLDPSGNPIPGSDHTCRTGKNEDCYALDVVSSPGHALLQKTAVYPLFGGTVKYAGCAGVLNAHDSTGSYNPFGKIVYIETTVGGKTYGVLYAHLTSISPTIRAAFKDTRNPALARKGVAWPHANQPIGTFGDTETLSGGCDGQGTHAWSIHLHFAVYQGATFCYPIWMVDGNAYTNTCASHGVGLHDGKAVVPEPLVGVQVYENFQWWNDGTSLSPPMTAADLGPSAGSVCPLTNSGRPDKRTCYWTTNQSNVGFDQKVLYKLHVKAPSGIKQVQLTASYHPDNDHSAGWSEPSPRFVDFQPGAVWRIAAICRPPKSPPEASPCTWTGIKKDAHGHVIEGDISYKLDQKADNVTAPVRWLPSARAAVTSAAHACVPMTLSFDVYDRAGKYQLAPGKLPTSCIAPAAPAVAAVGAEAAHTVYLQPQPIVDQPGDWPQFRNDAARLGYNTSEHTLSPANVADLGVAWTGTATSQWIFTSPTEANGVVYIDSDKLYAFAAGGCGGATCAPLWTSTRGGRASPAVANGMLYVVSGHDLLAFAAAGCGDLTCTPLWTGATFGGGSSSPAVANGVVYVGSDDAKLYTFAASGCGSATCAPLWTSTATRGGIDSSPAVANGVVYVGSHDKKLYAFAAAGCRSATCAPLWTSTATGDYIDSSPAVVNGVVYVGSYDKKLYAFAAIGCGLATCAPLWTSTATRGGLGSSPAVANGEVYIASGDGTLYAFAAGGCHSATCEPLWTGATGEVINYGGIMSSPAVANGVVYVGSLNLLNAFAAEGCGSPHCLPLWTSTFNEDSYVISSPAVANSMVYVGTGAVYSPGGGRLYAFSLHH